MSSFNDAAYKSRSTKEITPGYEHNHTHKIAGVRFDSWASPSGKFIHLVIQKDGHLPASLTLNTQEALEVMAPIGAAVSDALTIKARREGKT